MMNLEKGQDILQFESVVHSADLKNGAFINLGAHGTDDVYTVALPATATLATEEVLVVCQDETIYDNVGKNISNFVNLANVNTKAFHLAEGASWLIANADFSGTAVAGQFLIPADGTAVPVVSATPVGDGLAVKIVDIDQTIGYGRQPATRVRVVRVSQAIA